jgi:hypothetical protein
MNPDPSKLRQEHRQVEQSAELHLQQSQAAQDFASADELLRADAAQTPVPERIAERLKESIAREPKKTLSWWQRLFGAAK